MKNRGFPARMGFALAGMREAWLRESSFRAQSILAALAFVALLVLRPAPIWWAAIGLSCAVVLALELVNSAMEAAIDLLHPGIHPSIKLAKDMLAGGVLAMSLAALIVGIAMVVDTGPRFLAEVGLL